jgi:predicted transcriptional regulator
MRPDRVHHLAPHANSILTADEVRRIRRLGARRVNRGKIAAMFGVSKTAVSMIIRRQTWKWLP